MLRKKFELDKVAAGAKTEWELIERLAVWSASRWSGNGHLRESYPPWNALEILAPHRDGKPVGGFCLQFNLVLLQACESFGLVGRVVSLGPGNMTDRIRSGHEVVELWSNEHRKWVYFDGQFAWYAVDEASGRPLSLLELHDRQIAALAGRESARVKTIHLVEDGRRWESLVQFPPFIELRLIPRNNFLERRFPVPLNQGMKGWFWTGHYVWSDEAAPARRIYSHRVVKRENWEWSLNQAHAVLEATARRGEFRVHLDTATPGFDTFLAGFDGRIERPVRSGFLWKLLPGRNELRVRSRNIAGRVASPSVIVIAVPES